MLDHLKSFLGVTAEELKEEVILKQKDSVFYLILNRKGNAFNKDFVRGINRKLDIIDEAKGGIALVTVSAGKLFSGGLDLPFMASLPKQDGSFFVLELIRLYGRLMSFSCPTIALVKGAAYAGGCMLALAHDQLYVFQNATLCCNEVELGLPLPPGMNAVVKRRFISLTDYRDMALYAKKFSAEEGKQAGLVDQIIQDKPLQTIHQIATKKANYANNRSNFKKLKEEMNKSAIDCCYNKQHAVGVRGEIANSDSPFSKL